MNCLFNNIDNNTNIPKITKKYLFITILFVLFILLFELFILFVLSKIDAIIIRYKLKHINILYILLKFSFLSNLFFP